MFNKINIGRDKKNLIVYIVLTLITLAVFWQVTLYDFITFDDPVYITQNSHIQSGITWNGFCWALGTRYYSLWHPLVWLSFMFDYQLHGLNAGGYHVTNLILHILSTLLLFWLFNRMTGAIWRSAFIAAFFALHPLHVESVAWISERKDVLSAFFWMLTLCLYVYYTGKPVIKRYLLVLFSYVLALMSKPMVVTLPVIMILLDYWPLGRLGFRNNANNLKDVMHASPNQERQKTNSKKESLKENISPFNKLKSSETGFTAIRHGSLPLWEKIPFFVLSAVIVIVMLYAPDTPPERGFSFVSRLANAPVSFMSYLGKIFWPHDLSIFYPFTDQLPLLQVWGCLLLIIVISVLVILMMKKLPYLFVGWLWYAITLLPVIKIIQVGNDAMADRYTYLPSIGIAIALSWGVPFLFKKEDTRKRFLFPAGTAILAIFAILTWQQCGYWKNSIELFSHALQVTKDNYLAHNNIGFALVTEGRIEEAIDHYNKAIVIKQNSADNYNNRGAAFDKLGQHQRAIEDYDRAIDLKPDYAEAYFNRGNVYGELGKYQQAVENYNHAILLKPDYLQAYGNRAVAYLNQGNMEAGCSDAQKVCAWGDCRLLEIARGRRDCR
ncbi:MAG TPA: tetratricopeptide repeat protein [Smithella sp.]|nr:tetratricopeptide repeat protein [Smithella sp.]